MGISFDPDFPDASLARTGDHVAAVLGSLDNREELALQLRRSRQPVVEGESAARIVLEAFRCWGVEACRRMRGDFAGIVSDGNRLWAFRDHLGAQGLFCRLEGEAAYFASEAKQVAMLAQRPREPDLDALHRALFGWEQDGEPPVMIHGVERVPPASVLTFDVNGESKTERYWDPSDLIESANLSAGEARDRLVECLDQAVRRVLTGSDAVALSGGIDSPVIAAFGAQAHEDRFGHPLLALSTVYPHARSVDETPYINSVVEHLGIPWRTFVPQYRQLDEWQGWMDRFDGPVPNVDIPAVSEFLLRAKSFGASTVHFGELAELVFDLRGHLEGHLLLQGHLRTASRLLESQHRSGTPWPGLLRGLLTTLAPGWIARPLALRKDRRERVLFDWLDPKMVAPVEHRWDFRRSPGRRWPDLQLHFAKLPSNVGMEAIGTVSAYHGVSIRRPLADLDLWEFFLSLPALLKQGDPVRKAIVREAARGLLPDLVLDRTDKTGFTEDVETRVNYPALKKWILETDYRMKGVDYQTIAGRIEGGKLPLIEVNALNYLAGMHAFVSLW